MARKPSERRHSKERIEDLNLSPIMSILVILIPMLLYAFSFFEVKVQAVTAPRMGPSNQKPKDEDEKKPLNLTVLVTGKGFVVKQQAELTTEPEKPIFTITSDSMRSRSRYSSGSNFLPTAANSAKRDSSPSRPTCFMKLSRSKPSGTL